MKRFSQLAVISRAISAQTTRATTQSRLFQSAVYKSTSLKPQHWPSKSVTGFCGPRFFSAAVAKQVNEEATQSEKFSPKDVVLFQYEACPFCNKVRAFLDYYNIPYKVVEVNPINKKEIKWSEYKKVPILSVDGENMVDSTDIIDKLFKKIHPDKSAAKDDEEKKWMGWVDNHLVHFLSPNIYRSASEALESFNYITSHENLVLATGNFSFTERLVAKYAGAAAMYFVSKKLKKRHNITDERAALYEAADIWVDALKDKQFLGGTQPNLADLAVFGVLRPIRYLKSGRDMVENTRIGDWYARMDSATGTSSRINA